MSEQLVSSSMQQSDGKQMHSGTSSTIFCRRGFSAAGFGVSLLLLLEKVLPAARVVKLFVTRTDFVVISDLAKRSLFVMATNSCMVGFFLLSYRVLGGAQHCKRETAYISPTRQVFCCRRNVGGSCRRNVGGLFAYIPPTAPLTALWAILVMTSQNFTAYTM